MIFIKRASINDADVIAPLFDAYRQFYDCDENLALASDYIHSRLNNNDSIIFLAESDGTAAGFTQIYPSFCSVEAISILILYDLFVDSDFRKQGIAELLMQAAKDHALKSGAQRIDLLTGKTNHQAQSLYHKVGYKQSNQDFYSYSLDLIP